MYTFKSVTHLIYLQTPKQCTTLLEIHDPHENQKSDVNDTGIKDVHVLLHELRMVAQDW